MKTKRTIMPTLIGAVVVGSAFFFVLSSEPVPPVPRDRLDQHCLAIVERAKSGRARDLSRLRREFPDLFYQYKEYAIKVLEAMGTPAARDLLLDIACRKVKAPVPLDESAAWSFWLALKDRSEARRLFAAPNYRVRVNALTRLREAHVPIDADMLRSLEPMLQDTNLVVRRQAAMYLAMAKGPASGREKAVALIHSVETAHNAPDAQKPDGFYGTIGERWTRADFVYLETIGALTLASGINAPMLHELLPDKPGPERDCVLIALGNRGDRSVKPELWRIIRGTGALMLRSKALDALATVGDLADVPVLRRLAANDPCKVELTSSEKRVLHDRVADPSQVPNEVFPLRAKARSMIIRIQRATKQTTP